MNAADIIRTANAAGLTLAAKGDQLSVKPADRLSPELRRLLVAHKAAVLALLRQQESNLPPPRNRAWIIVLSDGTRITAVNSTDADEVEMLELAGDQFGLHRRAVVRAVS